MFGRIKDINALKRLSLFLISGGLLINLTGCFTPGLTGRLAESLPVALHSQETANWCWAASGQMVMAYLGHNVPQCTQANNRFYRSDCCNLALCPYPTAPTHDANGNCVGCACGGWPEFDKYGFTFNRTSGAALTWSQLKQQLSGKKKPVAFSWGWVGGGGHMMVAKGYHTLDKTDYVEIFDPWAPCSGDARIITYDFYNAAAADHTHWNDFYDVTYAGGR